MTKGMKKTAGSLLPVLICLAGILLLSSLWERQYEKAVFSHLGAYVQTCLERYPNSRGEVLGLLKEYQDAGNKRIQGNDYLEQFGYEEEDFQRGTASRGWHPLLAAFIISAGFLFPFWHTDRRNRKRIRELTEYLEQVNTQASGTLLCPREDDFSRLQDEIYKTVTNLRAVKDEAVKARERFAGHLEDIAHQLKTPITGALLTLELLEGEIQKDQLPGCQSSKKSLRCQSIRRKLEGLNRLEEALLTLSKIDSGALKLEKETVDVYTVLELAAENLEELMRQEGVSVEIPEKGQIQILGDMEWTMEALINLMKNCMEHSKRGEKIYCDYSRDLLCTEIRIWDKGEGFAKEDLPHLFERFYRGKNEKGKGCGIGLALARSIIEMENGSLTARNLPEGGACFEIRIR
ncbi:MAG TPA: HAMP domain-containing histidine kinase [Candidatus Choladousia intestinigallinarum]|mgnify:CR=1 FL=1|nr:HAMP domain-containing histidine kinase [Candidatus Choladousia intestinigallinarum]